MGSNPIVPTIEKNMSYLIVALTLIAMIASIIVAPKVTVQKLSFSPYWVIALVGAGALILTQHIAWEDFIGALTADTEVNPLKILTLFLSFTILSIYLDEVGFFAYIAALAVERASRSQQKLFFYLYMTTSILTVFTANDIIILTVTPFILYFAKNAKINPLPYVVMEFVAANTWSMLLIIGNPTNIYIATSFSIDFFQYAAVMFIPTVLTGLASYALLRWLFHRELNRPLSFSEKGKRPDSLLTAIGLSHLVLATITMSISSYLGIEMYLVTVGFALSLLITTVIARLFQTFSLGFLGRTILRLPWSLVPFFLSMTTLVIALTQQGFTDWMFAQLNALNNQVSYGVASFFASNLINNIPMSILFTNILKSGLPSDHLQAIYASIIGSNLGAIFTPVGALAGMMWMGILKQHRIAFRFIDFLRYGFVIGLPLLLLSLLSLQFII